MVVGNMVGAGIFVTPGIVAGHLPGAAWLLGAWLLGGLLSLAGAAVYGELGSRYPEAGGDYRYLHEAFGPLPAFLNGWAAFLLTFSAAAAAMAIAAVGYLQQALPGLERAPALAVQASGVVVILALTAANAAGSRIAGRTTIWFTALPLAGLAGLFVLGFATGSAQIAIPEGGPAAPASTVPASLIALGAAMLAVYWTYSGWNAAAYVASEMKDPRRNLPVALLAGTALVTALYLAVNGILVLSLPAAELTGSTTAVGDAASRLLGPVAERILAAVIALAILGSANVTLMAGARIYYAMASDGLAPRSMGRVNRAGVPGTALWIAGVWSALLAATGSFDLLLSWSALAILLLSSLTMAALLVLRRRTSQAPYHCPGYPFTPLAYMAASLAVAVASTVQEPRKCLQGVALVALGVPVYFFFRKRLAPSGRTSPPPG
jgi:APA family basic amino acid/polyamine antiporter